MSDSVTKRIKVSYREYYKFSMALLMFVMYCALYLIIIKASLSPNFQLTIDTNIRGEAVVEVVICSLVFLLGIIWLVMLGVDTFQLKSKWSFIRWFFTVIFLLGVGCVVTFVLGVIIFM